MVHFTDHGDHVGDNVVFSGLTDDTHFNRVLISVSHFFAPLPGILTVMKVDFGNRNVYFRNQRRHSSLLLFFLYHHLLDVILCKRMT